jgi:hypothetical protein
MFFQDGPDFAIKAANDVVVIHRSQQRILEHIVYFRYFLLNYYKQRIKLNELKSVHIDFTNKRLHNDQSTSMAHKSHMSIQQYISI